MNAIKGTVKNGQVVLDELIHLPDGTRIEILPVESRSNRSEVEEEPMTPEEIETVLAAMDRMEPLLMTTEEEAQSCRR